MIIFSFAGRLKKIVRKTDTIARFGGDEFVMVLGDFSHTEDMEKFAKKILDAFKEPFKIDKLKLTINGSIGISVFPNDSLSQSDLVKFADSVMYEAKMSGGNDYKFYLSIRQKDNTLAKS